MLTAVGLVLLVLGLVNLLTDPGPTVLTVVTSLVLLGLGLVALIVVHTRPRRY